MCADEAWPSPQNLHLATHPGLGQNKESALLLLWEQDVEKVRSHKSQILSCKSGGLGWRMACLGESTWPL